MRVNEMMQYSVLTATPDMPLALAWRLMEDHRIRHLPVLSDGHLVGLITDRDIRSASPSIASLHTRAESVMYMETTPVKSYMTHDVITVSPETDMARATQTMLDGRFGCLPVLTQDRLVGILTEIDLLRGYLVSAAPTQQTPLVVQDAMQDLLILVTPEDLVSTAYRRMQGGLVRHLPILDDEDKLVGVITDRDIRRAGAFDATAVLAQEPIESLGMMTVNDLMTTQVVTVQPETPLTEAAELFLTNKFGCLPVIREDHTLAGILTVTDLLGLYAQQTDADRDKL